MSIVPLSAGARRRILLVAIGICGPGIAGLGAGRVAGTLHGSGVPRVVVVSAASPAAGATAGAPRVAPLAVDTPTYSREIAPILFHHCAACHRPGGVAPFSVLRYEQVRRRASRIAAMVRSRRMPPWLPAPGRGAFAGERRLGEDEIWMLEAWARAGAPEGDATELPPRPRFEEGWQLGRPDLVLSLSEPFRLPAGGTEVFRNLMIPAAFEGTRWIEAVEFRMGNARVTHHAVLRVDTTGSSRLLDARDPEPGFSAMHAGQATMPGGFFLGWTPGRLPDRNPPGLAWPLTGGSDLVLELHLRPTDRDEPVDVEVGLHFADGPPARMPTVVRLASEAVDIPAGAADYAVTDSYTLPVDVAALGIYPHAHYLGREFQVVATLPDGRTEWLLHIADWDFNWQDAYRYRAPVPLPRGTVVSARIIYDNTAANPRNPHSPPRRVLYGPHSTHEMGDVFLQVLPREPADLPTLEEDLAHKVFRDRLAGLVHRTRVDDADADAHARLGDLLLGAGRPADAVEHYRRALTGIGGDGNLHYNLGVALAASGRGDAATEHFRRAVERIPPHAPAHYRLGRALLDGGAAREAAEHYRRAVDLSPDLAPALVDLAWLRATHPDPEIRDAAEALRLAGALAARVGPDHPVALRVLAAALAAAGRAEEAAAAVERALGHAEAAGDTALAGALREELAAYRRTGSGGG